MNKWNHEKISLTFCNKSGNHQNDIIHTGAHVKCMYTLSAYIFVSSIIYIGTNSDKVSLIVDLFHTFYRRYLCLFTNHRIANLSTVTRSKFPPKDYGSELDVHVTHWGTVASCSWFLFCNSLSCLCCWQQQISSFQMAQKR